ncbi:transposase, partial [Anaerobutyricum hallii]
MSILFAYEESISPAVVTKETTIGLDYKSDGLYVSSEGDTCSMPHYFRQSA